MKERKRRIARELAMGMTMLASFLCIACGAKPEENTATEPEEAVAESTESVVTESVAKPETASEESTEEQAIAEEQKEEEKEELSTWTADGNYIDDTGMRLEMYKTYKEYGYSKDGWGAMLLPGDEIYTGDLDEVDGKLTGTISIHADDGTPTEGIVVTLIDMGGSILMQKENGEEILFLADDTDHSNPNFLPMFSYNQVLADIGFDPLEAAAYDYLSFDYTNDYDSSNVMIPYVKIVDIDETDPKDVLLYGDYYIWEFKKEDDTLVAVSGGHCPGIIHLESSGDIGASYSPTGKMDEAFTDDDAKTLFGKYYDSYQLISSDDELREPQIAQVISDYVSANSLDVTKYKIGGEAAKELPKSRINN